MVKHFKTMLSVLMTAAILFTCCNKENTSPAEETSLTESSAAETTLETIQETVSVSPDTETQTTESESVTEPKSYEPYQIKLYDSLGTGMPRPDDYGEDRTRYEADGKPQIFFSHMKDKSVVKKIKSEIKEWTNSIEEKYNADGEKVYTNYCNAVNGILFYRKFFNYTFEEYVISFDMRTGERLELSDMFFEGEKFIEKLNTELWNQIQKLDYSSADNIWDVDYLLMKREFSGLTENEFYFSTDKFYFPIGNPYFQECAKVDVSLLDFDTVINIPYDMTELFEDGADEQLYFYTYDHNYTTNYYIQTGNINVYLFDESSKLTEKQREFLNNKALSLTSSDFLDKMRNNGWNGMKGWNVYSADEPPVYRIFTNSDGTEEKWKDFFTINISITKNNIAEICFRQRNVYEAPNPSYNLHYDLETLEPLDIEKIFEQTFGDEEYVWDYIIVYESGNWGNRTTDMKGFIEGEAPDLSKLTLENISVYDTEIYFDGRFDDCWIWGSISQK